MSKSLEEKYIITPSQIVEILLYCLNMTAMGRQASRKDWLPNVMTAIEGINGTQYMSKKVKLSSLAQYKREIREKLIGEVRKYFKEEYGVKNDIVTHKKPEHGNCCTCQTCGYYHEDCVCESNRVNKFLEKLNHTDKKEGGK